MGFNSGFKGLTNRNLEVEVKSPEYKSKFFLWLGYIEIWSPSGVHCISEKMLFADDNGDIISSRN